MAETTTELREKRAKAIADARAIHETAEKEKRSVTADEQERFDKFVKEARDLKTQIDGIDAERRRKEALDDLDPEDPENRNDPNDPERRSDPSDPGGKPNDGSDFKLTYRDRGRERHHRFKKDTHYARRASPAYRKAFAHYLMTGQARGLMEVESDGQVRALQVGDDVKGGFVAAPMQTLNEIIRDVDDALLFRQLCRIIPSDSGGIGVPTVVTKYNDADWTGEITTVVEDDSLRLGKREMKPHDLAKLAKVSNKLLRNGVIDIEEFVRGELSIQFGEAAENAYMNGDGSQKPLGIFVASDDGIGTSRDVSDGNDATTPKFDGLINARGALKQQYRRRASWIFHRDTVTKIMLLKDGNGQYIWLPGVTQDEPDRILRIPVVESEFAPNTFTTGQYVGCLGDFRWYWILDGMQLAFQRLVELYAVNNQTGFIGRWEGDGAPVKQEAFVRVKLG